VSEDAELIDATLSGDSDAFGGLVLKYQDRLFNTFVHVTGSSEDAQDVVQEAFVRAFVKLDTFQRASGFYTWLYRIAFNASSNIRRRRRPTESVERRVEASGQEPVDSGEGPQAKLQRLENQSFVQEAIARLDREHRVVLVLREIDGCGYEEIAEILGLPVGTVRSRLHRARIQLKRSLKERLKIEECEQ